MNGHPLSPIAMLLALTTVAAAQTSQQAATLTIAGQQDHAPLVRMNGKSYIDIESLARIVHGSIRFQGNQIILTLPGTPPGTEVSSGATVPPSKTQQLSSAYLNAEIEALTQIREWRAALVGAIQNNAPVTDSLVSPLRRAADSKVQLAVAATSTNPDQQAVALLRNELAAMQQESDQFVAAHAKANYTAPDSLDSNPLDQKIVTCQQALVSMASTKQFRDEIACH